MGKGARTEFTSSTAIQYVYELLHLVISVLACLLDYWYVDAWIPPRPHGQPSGQDMARATFASGQVDGFLIFFLSSSGPFALRFYFWRP